MTKYKIDTLSESEIKALGADLNENNEYITETAGFVPLEVKLKQFETNGLVAQFMTADFDSNDYRDIYLNPDFNISPEDDFEDIQEKLAMQREYAEKIKAAKSVGKNEPPAAAEGGTEDPKKETQPEKAE